MGGITEKITEFIKDLLTGWITSNLDTMFTDVNTKVETIAAEVGKTPQNWNSGIFSMIKNLSDNVIVPIAGMIITFVLCYELISMIMEKNNMHDTDTFMFFKYIFKMWVAVYLVTHTFDIAMAIFDVANHVVSNAGGMITGSASIDVTEALKTLLETQIEDMGIGELLGLYYGLNALSNNLIMVDRKRLKTPNGLILGTPGSGKSFATKREILNVFLITDDDIIICDPEGEYFPLVNALNGEVIKISAKSNDYINPMEVNLDVIYHPEKYRINGDVEDIDTIIADKAEFITSFCEVIMKKPQNAELNGDEVSMIDLCVKDIYKKYLYNDPKPENMPTLQDFYERLNFYAPDKPAAQNIANSLQLYVTGSQNVFNHRSNVDTQNRVVCFDIRELGTTLRKAGMLIVQHMVWTRVSQNRSRRKSTRYYVDEFHLLLNQPQTANYSIEMWKRFRKWGGIITGISQNVTDFLGSLAVESIVGNSDFILMLNQHSGDQKILAEKLNISKHQISFVNNSNAGEGLLFYGNVIIPFADRYPQDTRTYALMSTKPDEIQT